MTVDEQYIRSIVMPLGSDTPVITMTLTSRTIWDDWEATHRSDPFAYLERW